MNTFTGIKYYKLPIYPPAILFCMGSVTEDINAYISEYIGSEYVSQIPVDSFSDSNRGHTIFLEEANTIIVWIHKDSVNDFSIIAHECFHAVEYVMEHCGIIHSGDSSEAFAYLLSHVIEQIMK